jgi:hypothetical protein
VKYATWVPYDALLVGLAADYFITDAAATAGRHLPRPALSRRHRTRPGPTSSNQLLYGGSVPHNGRVTNSQAHYVTHSNPSGPDQGDVPALLRKVADHLERSEPIDVLDLTYHAAVTTHGLWPSVTVYYAPAE